jgi:hypothetical protein
MKYISTFLNKKSGSPSEKSNLSLFQFFQLLLTWFNCAAPFGQKHLGRKTFGQKTFGRKTFGQKTFDLKTFDRKTFDRETKLGQQFICRQEY